MEIFSQPEAWVALLTLTFLEIVLGVDNIIFISIVAGKLPEEKQGRTRTIGLLLALIFRLALLAGISYIIGFTKPILTIDAFDFNLSGRDIILAVGGMFLLYKSTTEIHHKLEQSHEATTTKKKTATVASVLFQIVMLDLVFSFDSILTAVGLTDHLIIMIIAVIIALVIMMALAGKISAFINKHPTLQILALSFLILIGFMLIVEGLHYHVPKGYLYFAVFFSLLVELLNMRMRKKHKPVQLHSRMEKDIIND
jgi:predicted tellurium resistance membrane protein TerC